MVGSVRKKSKPLKKNRGTVIVKHTNVVLDIDIDNRVLKGYVELHLVSKVRKLSQVKLHARQLIVEKVLYNGALAQFEQKSYLVNPCSASESIRDVKGFNIHHKAALDTEDKGTLIITFPETEEKPAKGGTFVVRVYYGVKDSTGGVHFVCTRETEVGIREEHGLSPHEILPPAHAFTHNQVEGARCWMPCLDRHSQLCTWNFQYRTRAKYVVISSGDLVTAQVSAAHAPHFPPDHFSQQQSSSHTHRGTISLMDEHDDNHHHHHHNNNDSNNNNNSHDSVNMMDVDSSNNDNNNSNNNNNSSSSSSSHSEVSHRVRSEFQRHEEHHADAFTFSEDDSNDTLDHIGYRTFFYELHVPTTAKNIAFVAGVFEIYPDPTFPNLTHFCLPGNMPALRHSVKFLGKAVQFFQDYLQSNLPYTSYKQVFVSECYTKMSSYAGLAILSTDLLHDERIIDQTVHTRWLLTLALSSQYFGNYIGIKSWSDMWLRFGLSSHLAAIFFVRLFGNNEHRFRIYKDFIKVAKLDEGKPPLNWHNPLHPIQFYQPLFLKKAPIIISMIERRLGHENFQKVMVSIVSAKSMSSLSSLAGMDDAGSSSSSLMLLDDDQSQSSRYDSLNSSVSSIGGNQQTGNGNSGSSGSGVDRKLTTRQFMKLLKKETAGPEIKLFQSQWITGRGCPKMLSGFNYNKKRQKTEFALKQLGSSKDYFSGSMVVRINELDGTYDHTIQFMDELQGEEFNCNSRLRKNRKKKIQYANGEEVEVDLSRRENPLLWIRVDPHCNWGPLIEFRQPEYMWIYQLEMDRDVIAQYQAIRSFTAQPSKTATLALIDVIKNPKHFYRIRMAAAKGLAACANKETEWVSLDKLLEFFKQQYYDPKLGLPSPNDFSDFPLYHLKIAILDAVSIVKDKEGYTPPDLLDFLLDLLKNNENSQNNYSDCKYLATIIKSLANTNTSTAQSNSKILKQVFRFLKLESLSPSYQRKITKACLHCLAELQANHKIDVNMEVFHQYTRYGHSPSVRLVAYKAILYLSCLSRSARDWAAVVHALDDPLECSRLKYKIFSSWNKLIRKNKIRVSMFHDKTQENIELCNYLWGYLNSERTAYDSRLRWEVFELYKRIWGTGVPACLPPQMAVQAVMPQPRTREDYPPAKPVMVSSSAVQAEREAQRERDRAARDAAAVSASEPLLIHIPSSVVTTPGREHSTASTTSTSTVVSPPASATTSTSTTPTATPTTTPQRGKKTSRLTGTKRKAPEYEAYVSPGNVVHIVFLKKRKLEHSTVTINTAAASIESLSAGEHDRLHSDTPSASVVKTEFAEPSSLLLPPTEYDNSSSSSSTTSTGSSSGVAMEATQPAKRPQKVKREGTKGKTTTTPRARGTGTARPKGSRKSISETSQLSEEASDYLNKKKSTPRTSRNSTETSFDSALVAGFSAFTPTTSEAGPAPSTTTVSVSTPRSRTGPRYSATFNGAKIIIKISRKRAEQ